MLKIVKFGGTSLATAEQLQKVKNIVDADPARRVIVPSAPGKAHKEDTKVTDLLYLVHELAAMKQSIDQVWTKIMDRFNGIISELGLDMNLSKEFEEIRKKLIEGVDSQYMASRGEALNGRIVAAYLDAEYIDAADVIKIASNGRAHPSSYDLIRKLCPDDTRRYVIPGFYGSTTSGEVATFSRGGSDVTGAIVANALDADVYENWTDVSGFLMTDPRIVASAKHIENITYTELRELSYMGAGVLHEEAVFPIREKGIPINIRNTNNPEDKGTMIVADRDSSSQKIVGIAGQKGFSVFYIEKAMMNEEIGFGRRVLDVFEHLGISYEHMPSGIDTVSVVVKTTKINGKMDQIMEDLNRLKIDNLKVLENMSLIATVGKGMNHVIGLAAKLFMALAEADINIRMIDQGSSEQNIIVGVEEKDHEKAIKAIYTTFA
ncbi:MAG: aspartate kinase [Spirochaetales bacterium]|nr:aspartate kinase [Spirochaetales bacterium]